MAWYRPSSGPPGALKGPVLAQNVPFEAPEVPGRPLEDQIWLQCNYLDTPHGCIPTKNISDPNLAKTGPFGAHGGTEDGRDQAKMCGYHVTKRVGPIGGSWDQIWPPRLSEDLRGAQKGPFGAPGVP